MKSILLAISLLICSPLIAGVKAYQGTAGEKLYIESAPKLDQNTYLIKFEGVNSKWSGKVIKTKMKKNVRGKARYSFEYKEVLSAGTFDRTYQIVIETGKSLIKGSQVQQVQLFVQENDYDKPVTLNYSQELTEKSQSVKLYDSFKKEPYQPTVD